MLIFFLLHGCTTYFTRFIWVSTSIFVIPILPAIYFYYVTMPFSETSLTSLSLLSAFGKILYLKFPMKFPKLFPAPEGCKEKRTCCDQLDNFYNKNNGFFYFHKISYLHLLKTNSSEFFLRSA